MYNPFVESDNSDAEDSALVQRAQGGDKQALDALVRRHQAWIYNVALRMVWEPRDAEDATQEVLIKVITKLGSFQGASKFRTWLYRIVVNHIMNMQRRGLEVHEYTFARMGAELDETPDGELPDPKTVPVDVRLLVEEAKIGCVSAMLLCLDRKQRLVYVLAEMFGVSDQVGGDLMEISPDNFRQSLARARRDLYSFMNDKCGLINEANPCRCAKKTRAFMEAGFVDAERLRFVPAHVAHIRDIAPKRHQEITALSEDRYAEIFRDQSFLPAPKLTELLERTIADEQFRDALHLDA